MKKAKLMLAAIAIFAVAGGALAFNAKNAYNQRVYLAPDGETPATITLTGATLTTAGTPSTFATTIYSATAPFTVTVPAL